MRSCHLCHGRKHALNLLNPGTCQQCHYRPFIHSLCQFPCLFSFEIIQERSYTIHQGISRVFHIHSELFKPVYLKGKNYKKLFGESFKIVNASLFPGPHLRSNKIEYPHPVPACKFRNPHIKPGIINRNDNIGFPLHKLIFDDSQIPEYFSKVKEHIQHHIGRFFIVHHPIGSHCLH